MGVKIIKALIVFESKYGNTKRVAEEIMKGINEVGGGRFL